MTPTHIVNVYKNHGPFTTNFTSAKRVPQLKNIIQSLQTLSSSTEIIIKCGITYCRQCALAHIVAIFELEYTKECHEMLPEECDKFSCCHFISLKILHLLVAMTQYSLDLKSKGKNQITTGFHAWVEQSTPRLELGPDLIFTEFTKQRMLILSLYQHLQTFRDQPNYNSPKRYKGVCTC